MYPFPSSCPQPRISHSKTRLKPRSQPLFGDICRLVKPSSILEVGSWMGASAIAWAEAASDVRSDAVVYCVDTWLGSVEHFLSSCGDEWNLDKLSLTDYGPTFFDDFLRNIWDSGFQDRILPFRAASSSALPFFAQQGLAFDVVYVDGAHDSHSVLTDVAGALQVTSEQGLVCGDDFGWSSVRNGLRFLALTHTKTLHIYVRGHDFVVLTGPRVDYGQSLVRLGYARWRPLDVRENLYRAYCWCRWGLPERLRPPRSSALSSGG